MIGESVSVAGRRLSGSKENDSTQINSFNHFQNGIY